MSAFATLVQGIAHWAEKQPDKPATHGLHRGAWVHKSWGEHWESVRAVAQGLIALGLSPGQVVAMVGPNRMEWAECQFGVQAAAGLPVPLYATSSMGQLRFILEQTAAQTLICGSDELLQRFLQAEQAGEIPRLRSYVAIEPPSSADDRVLRYQDFLQLGRNAGPEALNGRLAGRDPKAASQLIYTSGTTGEPKGVMMDDAGQLEVLEGLVQRFPTFAHRPYRVVSYLPLSHQAEQLVTNVGTVRMGGEVYFCPEISGVREALVEARPTLFLAVPRVWEKFEVALRSRLSSQQGVAKWLSRAATAIEYRGFERDRRAGRAQISLPRRLARKVVIDRVRAGLGLDQLEVALAGSAPTDVQTLRFFAGLGIPIYEAYGLTETSGVATCNVYGKPMPGTVGPALPGVEMRLADDGEVLLRSAMNTQGYFRDPGATAELYTEDGYLRTGDLGEVDAEGSLRITGRKKELLITAGGKNVAPVEIEQRLNRLPGVAQSLVVGDRHPYLCALMTLDAEQLPGLARAAQVQVRPLTEMASDRAVHEFLWSQVERECNAQLARYQTIKKIRLLPGEFSVDSGELTPSMKLRRKEITTRYAREIAELYAS